MALVAGAPPGRAEAAGQDLLDRYAEPQRRYHDRRHLTEVLDAVDLLAGQVTEVGDLVTVQLAAWFHDAVYDPEAGAGANEEASAALAEEVLAALGQPPTRVAAVAALVRATADHQVADDLPPIDAAVLFDADLAILAAPAERYMTYAADVRAEYAHVPHAAFRSGRAAILQGFLDRPRIYRTHPAYQAWEQRARTNLATEIAELAG
jgi:predicted metal-dependent HD superfamily phosphohydrolase